MNEPIRLHVQGHRGARGLRPENTLTGFELALDLGVASIETDLHLSRDGILVLFHDVTISEGLCSLPAGGAPAPTQRPLVSRLTLTELRAYRVDRNPDPARFPQQENRIGPLARAYAERHGIDPLGIPTLTDLFAFAADYAGEPGRQAGKTPDQQRQAVRVVFDLELKRVPFWPHTIGDGYDGTAPGLLERRMLGEIDRAGVRQRTLVRSFDHRCVRLARQLCPGLQTAVLVAHTAPVRPANLLGAAGADVYCPDYHFLDADAVRQVHDAGKTVLPWTVNQPEEWERLVSWGVDGITTDFPDRLIEWLRGRAPR
jgi:glycerophosphoryl diester phosphodiesterase